jgi:hypothetical protein
LGVGFSDEDVRVTDKADCLSTVDADELLRGFSSTSSSSITTTGCDEPIFGSWADQQER